MGSEHSVVTALAELGRLEQERVEGERRQAARERVQALEQDLARRAGERFERELAQRSTRLEAEHAAHVQALQERLDALQLQLAAAEAGREVLRAALEAQAQVRPDARAGKLVPAVLVAVVCLLAALAFGQHVRMGELELRRAVAAPVVPIDPTTVTDTVTDTGTGTVTATVTATDTSTPVRTAGPRRPNAAHKPTKPATGPRVHVPTGERDPLGTLDRCPEDDPTCGLELAD